FEQINEDIEHMAQGSAGLHSRPGYRQTSKHAVKCTLKIRWGQLGVVSGHLSGNSGARRGFLRRTMRPAAMAAPAPISAARPHPQGASASLRQATLGLYG